MIALVTGGAGFIGSHIIEHLDTVGGTARGPTIISWRASARTWRR